MYNEAYSEGLQVSRLVSSYTRSRSLGTLDVDMLKTPLIARTPEMNVYNQISQGEITIHTVDLLVCLPKRV